MNYFQHHLGDYARDTAHLSMLEDGAYRRLLDLYYSTEKPLATDRAKLYRLIRAQSKQERAAVDTVLTEFFSDTPEGWRHSRCDTEIAKAKDKSDKARKSIEARWKNERNTNVQRNEIRTYNECNTPNNQEPIANNQEPKEKPKTKAPPQAAFVVPDWVPTEAWEGWLATRKTKRAPNSAHALSLAVSELEKLRRDGYEPSEVLNQSTVRGWTGLFPLKRDNGSGHGPSMIPGERL